MIKQCAACGKSFPTKDSRQKNCSKLCANVSRAAWRPRPSTVTLPPPRADLPPPEELPAPYAKRVYDMWVSLLGDDDTRTRIA